MMDIEQFYNKHYEHTDTNGYVIKAFSDAFERPLETDICVNEQGDRHYNPSLFDNRGCYMIRYIDGVRHEQTEEERQQEYDSQIDINALKQEKIAETKTKLADWLQNNPLLFTDSKYYSVTQEKQNLMNNAIAVYQMKLQAGITNPELKWNSNGDECTVWTLAQLSVLALAISDYLEPIISYQQGLELQIKSYTTVKEISGMVIDYDSAHKK